MGFPATEKHPVCVSIFLSHDCPGCPPIKKENIAALAHQLGCEIKPRYFFIEDEANYRLLVRLEEKFRDEGNEIPVVFLGSHILGGRKEIEKDFERLIRDYAASGGAESHPQDGEAGPVPPSAGPRLAPGRAVYIAYFDTPGCEHCRRTRYMLAQLCRDFPAVRMQTYLTSERSHVILQEAMCERLRIPAERRVLTPCVIVGRRGFVQAEVSDRALRECVTSALASGTACPWAQEYDLAAAERRLRARLYNAGIGAVILGGLIDGINPCAFGTLILFISYMRKVQSRPIRLLASGGSFILGVFLVYLAVGLGLWELVSVAEKLAYVDTAITWAIIAVCVLLAAASAADAVKAGRGRYREITLQLPKSVKQKIQSVLIHFGRVHYLILGGLLIGGFISLLELVCTGQVYFPLIKVMVNAAGPDRIRALGLLVVYNLCFILPLVAIFAAAYWGVTSDRLTQVLRRNMTATKTVTALFFTGLAALLAASKYFW